MCGAPGPLKTWGIMAETNNSGKLAVKLVTPDRVLIDSTADAVELPSSSGLS